MTAGRAFARELRRAGERRLEWLEWCRLSRGGDVEAWEADGSTTIELLR